MTERVDNHNSGVLRPGSGHNISRDSGESLNSSVIKQSLHYNRGGTVASSTNEPANSKKILLE